MLAPHDPRPVQRPCQSLPTLRQLAGVAVHLAHQGWQVQLHPTSQQPCTGPCPLRTALRLPPRLTPGLRALCRHIPHSRPLQHPRLSQLQALQLAGSCHKLSQQQHPQQQWQVAAGLRKPWQQLWQTTAQSRMAALHSLHSWRPALMRRSGLLCLLASLAWGWITQLQLSLLMGKTMRLLSSCMHRAVAAVA